MQHGASRGGDCAIPRHPVLRQRGPFGISTGYLPLTAYGTAPRAAPDPHAIPARGGMAILLMERYFALAQALAQRIAVMDRGGIVLACAQGVG